MKRYSVVISQTAEKELSKLPTRTIEKIITVQRSLEGNPNPVSCKTCNNFLLATLAAKQ